MPELEAQSSLSAVIDDCEAALKANAPAEAVLRVESHAAAPRVRARWLIAKGVAANRLGPREALGDFGEAAEIAERSGDGCLVAEAKRAATFAHAWRGEGRRIRTPGLPINAVNRADASGPRLSLEGAQPRY